MPLPLSRVFSPILCSSMSDWWRVMPIKALAKKTCAYMGAASACLFWFARLALPEG